MKKFLIPVLALSLLANAGFSADKKKEAPADKAAKAKVEKTKGDKAAKQAKQAEAKPNGSKPKPVLVDLTLSGKISKKETVGKNERKYTYFYLETSDKQKIRLTQKALGKKSTVKLDDFVNANVTVRGKGFKRKLKNGDERTYIQQIAALEK